MDGKFTPLRLSFLCFLLDFLFIGSEGTEDIMLSVICLPFNIFQVQGMYPRQAVRNFPHPASLK